MKKTAALWLLAAALASMTAILAEAQTKPNAPTITVYQDPT